MLNNDSMSSSACIAADRCTAQTMAPRLQRASVVIFLGMAYTTGQYASRSQWEILRSPSLLISVGC